MYISFFSLRSFVCRNLSTSGNNGDNSYPCDYDCIIYVITSVYYVTFLDVNKLSLNILISSDNLARSLTSLLFGVVILS